MPEPDEAWCEKKAAPTLDPDRCQTSLSRLMAAWPDQLPSLPELVESFPLGEDSLLHLLAYSPITTEKLVRDPAALAWLAEPGICTEDRRLWQMQVDLARAKGEDASFNEHFTALRRQKARETTRIALREISRTAPLSQTALELSFLAELCVSEVYQGWLSKLGARWGNPEGSFCVLGMGKLGGGELNYSSDIDVIFFYSDDGQLKPSFSYKDFFTRLGEKIVATFSAAHDAGPLFRIDLRLRPDGNAGPLVRSLSGMEHYYAAYGETWERMALLKARPVAGDPELGYEFLHRLQPFTCPRHLTVETLQEIAALKQRIDTELIAPNHQGREIKRGRGGIREIEFVIQSLQLLNGARHPFLQQQNTLKALGALKSLGDESLLDSSAVEALTECYGFLRTLEHRLMIAEEKQSHLVPDDPAQLENLRASLGFASVPEFQEQLRETNDRVHRIFDAHFSDLPAPPEQEFSLNFFRAPDEAEKLLAKLGGEAEGGNLSARARRVFRGLKPSFLKSLSYAAEPDLVLNRFSRFIENYGIRATLYELLIQHPRLLELLTKLFDASSFVSEVAIRRPELVDEVARTGEIDRLKSVADYLEELAHGGPSNDLSPGDRLRAFHNGEIVRIALRDVLALAPLDDVLREYTSLAEAGILHYLRTTGADQSLTVVAMGKFGAQELSYGSDLDVIFIGDDMEAATKLLAEFKRPSEEGTLDEIDARLRPEGRSGALVCTLESYKTYFQGRGELWEAQALTKARPICGPEMDACLETMREIWTRFGRDPNLFEKIRAMLDRIHEQRGSGQDSLDFKTGHGGIVDLEFAVQAHQMRAGLWENNTLAAAAKLSAAGAIPDQAAREIDGSYRFLRRCAFVLRRQETRGISTLPADPDAQQALAARLGFKNTDAFLDSYGEARARAREVADRLLAG